MTTPKKSPTKTSKQRTKTPLKIRLKQTWQKIVVRTPKDPHHAFRLTSPRMYLTSSDLKATWRMQIDTWRFIWKFKWMMIGLGLLYSVLMYVLVGGISQIDYVAFKDATLEVKNGDLGAIGMAFSLFGAALTGGLNTTPSSLQQFLSATLMLYFWLSVVWAARMLAAGKEIKLRDALYNCGAPVIPTLVVMAVIALQLLPGALGIFAYSAALSGGWLAGGIESMSFAIAAVLLGLLSAYMVVSSLTALVVVTLPGTYPWQALRVAREMVMNHRWAIVLRVLVMMLHIVLIWAVVLIPIFLLDQWLWFDWLPLVPIAVQLLLGVSMIYSSVYIYRLYRSLL